MNLLLTAAFVLIALAVLLWVWRARAWSPQPAVLEAVSVAAIARVLDDSDEPYWSAALSASDLRKARRMRIEAALDYMRRVRANAAILLQLGEAARQSSDPGEAERGEGIVQVAIQLRLRTFWAMLRLRAALMFPSISVQPGSVVPAYTQLESLARGLRIPIR